MTVYFIRAGKDGPVKIGWAQDVEVRLSQLQCHHYDLLKLIRVVEGDRNLEVRYHFAFRHVHRRGEWFDFHQSMLTLVNPPRYTKPRRGNPRGSIPTVTRLVDVLGGVESVAEILGVPRDDVILFRFDNFIPLRHHLAIEQAMPPWLALPERLFASRTPT